MLGPRSLFAAFAAVSLAAPAALAQTLPSGVINAPPTVIEGWGQSIGTGTTLNVFDGGFVDSFFEAGLPDGSSTEVAVNIDGGHVGSFFRANGGSVVNVRRGELGRGAFGSSPLAAGEGSSVHVSGGVIHGGVRAASGSTVVVTGGAIGDRYYTVTSGNSFDAQDGSSVSISGGVFGDRFAARSGSNVTLSGGEFGSFEAEAGSTVTVGGGSFGSSFHSEPGSDVRFVGGDFLLNGSPYTDSTITLSEGDLFTGTFENGGAFLFGMDSYDRLNGVTLTPSALPVVDTTPMVIEGGAAGAPAGLRAGQTLTLRDGGRVGRSFAVVDATLNVEGGRVHQLLESARSVVNLTHGSLGTHFKMHDGTTVNVSGGEIGVYPRAYSGSTVNLSGGAIGPFFYTYPDTTINVSGGVIEELFQAGSIVNVSGGRLQSFTATSGSEVSITGGLFGGGTISTWAAIARSGSNVSVSGGLFEDRFIADSGSEVEFFGGEFHLNGEPYTESSVTLGVGDVLTGTFANGDPFLFSRNAADELAEVTLVTTEIPPADTAPMVFDGGDDASLSGLRPGQTLVLRDGGALGSNFAVNEAELTIEGGVVGSELKSAGSAIEVAGGFVRDGFAADRGSTVVVSGGSVGRGFEARRGSNVSIIGGAVESGFVAQGLSSVEVSGGSVGDGFQIAPNSQVTLSGGTVGRGFTSDTADTTEIVGGEFKINGFAVSPIRRSIPEGDVFTGTLADGSPFVFTSEADDELYLVTLTAAELPAIDTTPMVVDGATASAPAGLREGQTLALRAGGSLRRDFAVVDALLEVEGGEVGTGLEAARSTVRISGGAVGAGLAAYDGSSVVIEGGTVGPGIQSLPGSTVELVGNDFRLNGEPVTESSLSFGRSYRLTGVLADGAPILFTHLAADSLDSVNLTLIDLPDAESTPLVVDGSRPATVQGLRPGQSLTLRDGGTLGSDFTMIGAALSVEGGKVGSGLEIVDSQVTISGGVIGSGIRAFSGSVIDLRGGVVGSDVDLYGNLTVSGGVIGADVYVRGDATVTGGEVGDNLNVDGDLLISGGRFDGHVTAGSTTLIGADFYLDGVELDLTPGFPTRVYRSGVSLETRLLDGEFFGFDLKPPQNLNGQDPFTVHRLDPGSLTLVLVPDPGDYNGDGQVDAADYGVFQSRYGEEVVPYSYADGNGDGRIDAADYTVWRDNVAPAIAASVPEPAGACLVALAISWATSRKRERPE